MKVLINMCLLTLIFASCTNNNELKQNLKINKNIELQSSITLDTLQNIVNKISELNLSRNEDDIINQFSEDSCKKILEPLIIDGEQIKDKIIWQYDSLQMLGYQIEITEDIEYVRNLTNEELASLSFLVYNVNTFDQNFLEENIYGAPLSDPYIYDCQSSERILACATVALGWDEIKKLSVTGVVNATTIRSALMAIGKRYLGYVGVALMVYNFGVCISS